MPGAHRDPGEIPEVKQVLRNKEPEGPTLRDCCTEIGENSKGVGGRAVLHFRLTFIRKRGWISLQGMHRENLQPLKIEGTMQEGRDKRPTAGLLPTGSLRHFQNRHGNDDCL